MSKLEEKFLNKLREANLPEPLREYKFHKPKPGDKKRLWRFDFCYPDVKVAVEIEGGTYSRKGRHTSGAGYAKDCEKYNTATLQGWRVFRFTGKMLDDAIRLLLELNATENLKRDN